MKKIWKFLKVHWKEDYSARVYLPSIILLIILIIINYRFDFEDNFLDSQQGVSKFFFYFVFYAVPYYTILSLDRNIRRVMSKAQFYIITLLGLSVLSLDASVPFLQPMLSSVDPLIRLWSYKVTVNLISLFTIVLPLYIFYAYYDKARSYYYGLGQRKFDMRPYVAMLLIMLPLIVLATTQPAFLRQYPMYKSTMAHEYLGVPEWVTVMTYEFAYGFDFITVELLFRGFFVIGMTTLLGRRSVFAMAFIYCLLHFGKPAGEAISSVFGGYILGVIAFETRSIWGGIIVHLGIAWMMEIISFAAKQF